MHRAPSSARIRKGNLRPTSPERRRTLDPLGLWVIKSSKGALGERVRGGLGWLLRSVTLTPDFDSGASDNRHHCEPKGSHGVLQEGILVRARRWEPAPRGLRSLTPAT